MANPLLVKIINELKNKLNQPKISYVGDETVGVLVSFPTSALRSMIEIRLWGNGYMWDKPINTIIQGYHNAPKGSFLACIQSNYGCGIDTCSFGIYNDKICLWIPANFSKRYRTFIIDTVFDKTLNVCNVQEYKEKPDIENETSCIISS